MRDFLFRGKNIDADVWEYGDLVRNADGKTFIRENYQGMYIFREVHPETVGQYTGLKDNNGRMVYEGDIVQDPDDGTLAEIVWNKENARFYIRFFGENVNPEFIECYEIIGNKWDNPELIRGMHGPVLAYKEDEE